MIVDQIRLKLLSGVVIPKPAATADFIVKGWGRRRGDVALVYLIPNHTDPEKPHEKGITEEEFEVAYTQLTKAGELTRSWFNASLPACAKEGACNFTTVGGVFQLLGVAEYSRLGVYLHCKPGRVGTPCPRRAE